VDNENEAALCVCLSRACLPLARSFAGESRERVQLSAREESRRTLGERRLRKSTECAARGELGAASAGMKMRDSPRAAALVDAGVPPAMMAGETPAPLTGMTESGAEP